MTYHGMEDVFKKKVISLFKNDNSHSSINVLHIYNKENIVMYLVRDFNRVVTYNYNKG